MPARSFTHPRALDLRPGERVRVREMDEILATLDARGTLDGMPFMPEMAKQCGRIFSVSQRADKTCAGDGVVRRMRDAVHLGNVRCDGAAHGGCQAACLVYWKEAWLARAGKSDAPASSALEGNGASPAASALLELTMASSPSGAPVYRCQATEIPRSTGPRWRLRDVDQYAGDVRNFSLRKLIGSLGSTIINMWQSFSRSHLPPRLRIADGREYPFITGQLAKGATPSVALGLHEGDLVRIKSRSDIVATLDRTNHNRGLSFDGEMARYCGRTARVRGRVERLIDERTGEMIAIGSDCIILEGVVCAGDYHRLCTRAIYPFWREAWLERVNDRAPAADFTACHAIGERADPVRSASG